ncbi:hypothetical protein RI367_003996 [Sorochytrium milnesiophthora]
MLADPHFPSYEEQARRLAWLYERNAEQDYRIRQVSVDGALHTKRSVFQTHLAECMRAATLSDIVIQVRSAASQLQQLGIFEEIEVVFDTPDPATSRGQDGARRLLDVTLKVKERSRFAVRTGTEMGNDDGNITASMNVRNVFGRAETLHSSASYGYRTSAAFDCKFSKPLNASPNSLVQLAVDSAHRNSQMASSFDELSRSVSTRFLTLSPLGVHTLALEGAWRQVCNVPDYASLSVRHEAGHSLKCGVTHVLDRDRRDDALLPTRGYLCRLSNEFAGLYGDVKHVKNEAEAQYNWNLGRGFSLSTTLRTGLIVPLAGTTTRINDRFFIGGPTSVRGFRWSSIGPKDAVDYLGGDAHYQVGVSLLTPLPRLADKSWLRGLLFVNAGSLTQLDRSVPLPTSLQTFLSSPPSVSAGVGLAIRHQICRLELNWGVPLVMRRGDASVPGFQFGIGLSFLIRRDDRPTFDALPWAANMQPSCNIGKLPVHIRPGLTSFLYQTMTLSHLDYAVWTSAGARNAEAMVSLAFPTDLRDRLLFVWHRDQCDEVPGTAWATYKNASRIFKLYPQYGPHNTLIIDDSIHKLSKHPRNALIIPSWNLLDPRADPLGDRQLSLLTQYLTSLNQHLANESTKKSVAHAATDLRDYIARQPFAIPLIDSVKRSATWVTQWQNKHAYSPLTEEQWAELLSFAPDADADGSPALAWRPRSGRNDAHMSSYANKRLRRGRRRESLNHALGGTHRPESAQPPPGLSKKMLKQHNKKVAKDQHREQPAISKSEIRAQKKALRKERRLNKARKVRAAKELQALDPDTAAKVKATKETRKAKKAARKAAAKQQELMDEKPVFKETVKATAVEPRITRSRVKEAKQQST